MTALALILTLNLLFSMKPSHYDDPAQNRSKFYQAIIFKIKESFRTPTLPTVPKIFDGNFGKFMTTQLKIGYTEILKYQLIV